MNVEERLFKKLKLLILKIRKKMNAKLLIFNK